MNVAEFLALLQKSETILSPKQTRALEDMLVEYPYFQAARALYLKGLKNLDSYKYNSELKTTAAYTADREVLFDFINSRKFDQNKIANSIAGRDSNLPEIKTIAETVEPSEAVKNLVEESEEKPLPQNIEEAEDILHPELFEEKEVVLENTTTEKPTVTTETETIPASDSSNTVTDSREIEPVEAIDTIESEISKEEQDIVETVEKIEEIEEEVAAVEEPENNPEEIIETASTNEPANETSKRSAKTFLCAMVSISVNRIKGNSRSLKKYF